MRCLLVALLPGALFALLLLAGCSDPPQSSKRVEEEEIDTVSQPAGPVPKGMVWVPGGEFEMGSADPNPNFRDARPVHKVWVDGFWMDRTEVTNEQFARFVKATGYKTYAERVPLPEDLPGVAPENLVAGSAVFTPENAPAGSLKKQVKGSRPPWWSYVRGADWQHPLGPRSTIEGMEKHPAVHIAWEDAVAYAEWAKKRLPTEAEWERAARGGKSYRNFYWGEELTPRGKWRANIFQGDFPRGNTAADGYARTAPVASYPANAYGLYDMSGNVWEWCSDWYRSDYYSSSPYRNPQGPSSSDDPIAGYEPRKVQRGGSFYCSDQYCNRYRAGSRWHGEPRSTANHTGFRCVRTAVR